MRKRGAEPTCLAVARSAINHSDYPSSVRNSFRAPQDTRLQRRAPPMLAVRVCASACSLARLSFANAKPWKLLLEDLFHDVRVSADVSISYAYPNRVSQRPYGATATKSSNPHSAPHGNATEASSLKLPIAQTMPAAPVRLHLLDKPHDNRHAPLPCRSRKFSAAVIRTAQKSLPSSTVFQFPYDPRHS